MNTLRFGKSGAGKLSGGQRVLALVHIVVGFLLAALGCAMSLSLPWSEGRAFLASRDWPVAQATILSLSLSEETRTNVRGDDFAPALVLRVSYCFEVDGHMVEGTRATLNDTTATDDRRLRSLYGRLNFARLTGRSVPVAYDPADPSVALLDRNFDWSRPFWRAGIAGLAILFGAGLALGGLRGRP